MEGSESEAIFESLNLKPQLFINEVFNIVDDLVEEAFDYFLEQASTALNTDGTDRTELLRKGVGRIRNLILSALDPRLANWEKYCIRHCFVVPPGFSLPKDKNLSGDNLLDLNTLEDSELDAQLGSLRRKLALAEEENAKLRGEISNLERQSELSNHSTASLDEVLQLYEKYSTNDAFQELKKTASEFRTKIEKLNARKIDDPICSRSVRKRLSNGDIFKEPFGFAGVFDAKLEDLQQILDDIKSA